MRTSRPLGDVIDVAAERLRSGEWLTLRALDVPWAAKAEGVSICKVMPLRATSGFWPHGGAGEAGVTLPVEAAPEVKDPMPCMGGTTLKLAPLGVQEPVAPNDLDTISCAWDMACLRFSAPWAETSGAWS